MYSRQPSTCRTNPSALAKRDVTGVERSLGRAGDVERVQQAQVQRDREQRVGHRPVVVQDRVFVWAEVRQAELDEVRERAPRLPGGRGEPARTIAADGREVEGVEVGADPLVDLVLRRLPRCDQAEGPLPARRWFAVLVVEVPRPADRLAALNEHVEAAALGSVEVLHPEGLTIARPRGELRARQREGGRRQDVGDQPFGPQLLDEAQRVVRGGFVDDDRAPDPRQRLPVGVRAQVGGAVAQLGGEVAHPGEHEVQLLPVEPLAAQDPRSTRRARPPARGARRWSARAGRAGRRRATAARWSCAQSRGAGGHPRPDAGVLARPCSSVRQDVRRPVRRGGPA